MTSERPAWPCSIAVDVGGTFTDLVLIDHGGTLTVTKVPSVGHDPSKGVLDAVDAVADSLGLAAGEVLANCERFVHGSTVATNAVLEGNLSMVGLITTAGFRDGLEIRRGIRADQWDHRAPWPAVLVPRHLRRGVAGRINASGEELTPLDEAAVTQALEQFATQGVEAVAICLLHSYLNPAHEQRAAELCRDRWPEELTVVSSELTPLLGEYERTLTAVVNAGLVPTVGGYLRRLAGALAERGLSQAMLLMQSNGGTVPLSALAARPVDLMLSGPAAVGGALRRSGGDPKVPVVSMEIGGTSCDVAVMIDGSVPVIDGLEVGGYHMNIAAVDVHTVGAGGGTLAQVDTAGMLQVGPRGAGAVPGPACYDRGGVLPTATDAHLLLGRLRPGRSAGGALDLSEGLADDAMVAEVGGPLSLTSQDAAVGVITVLEQHLRQAVETITIERGRDPALMTLVAAGGAGGLHGSPVARALGCRTLVIPAEAGVFCAIGMLHSNLRRDVSRSMVVGLEDLGPTGLQQRLAAEQERADALTASDWPANIGTELSQYVDLRYPGQLWSVRVWLDAETLDLGNQVDEIRRRFEAEYRRLYGHIQPAGVLEVTGVGVVVIGDLGPSASTVVDRATTDQPTPLEHRRCWLGANTGWDTIPVFRGQDLEAGHRLSGPYLIEASTTTVLGLPGDQLEVQPNGDLEVALR